MSVTYGSASLSGKICSGFSVSLDSLSAGQPKFGVIDSSENFLNGCNSDDEADGVYQGIAGIAFTGSLQSPFTQTLLGAVVAQTEVPSILAMQCCGWDGA